MDNKTNIKTKENTKNTVKEKDYITKIKNDDDFRFLESQIDKHIDVFKRLRDK